VTSSRLRQGKGRRKQAIRILLGQLLAGGERTFREALLVEEERGPQSLVAKGRKGTQQVSKETASRTL